MIAADTNVWARAYLNDDEAQARKARNAIAAACTNGGIFVPLIVLAELYWVLKSKWTRDRVLDTIERLCKPMASSPSPQLSPPMHWKNPAPAPLDSPTS